MIRHGSLFSGIGGFDLAAEWMGWENVFQCEKEEFCQRVLRFYWPKARLYGDVRKFDATVFRGIIDVLSGGFPCQPFSVAGKRMGTSDDRYLWPEMYRIINEIRPRWVVGENVLGLLNWRRGMVFEQVQTDLEAAGFEVWAYILPAAGIGAPHKRDRVWIVAHAGRNGCGGYPATTHLDDRGNEKRMVGEHDADTLFGAGVSANADGERVGTAILGSIGDFYKTAGPNAGCDIVRGAAKTNWDGFPTQSAFCAGDDGFSTGLDGIAFSGWRYQSLRGAGNAVVPGVVMEIFKTIERMERYER
jgi:DNA (cytosine-5)-methyltransferase 1